MDKLKELINICSDEINNCRYLLTWDKSLTNEQTNLLEMKGDIYQDILISLKALSLNNKTEVDELKIEYYDNWQASLQCASPVVNPQNTALSKRRDEIVRLLKEHEEREIDKAVEYGVRIFKEHQAKAREELNQIRSLKGGGE